MNARSTKLALETLEDRCVPATVAYGDFNHDGLIYKDRAEITGPRTVTVSLANADGSYTVSAILTAPKGQSLTYINVYDSNGDGNDDIYASGSSGGGPVKSTQWYGNGDGTFDDGTSDRWHWRKFRWI